jgi:hypothetical protein
MRAASTGATSQEQPAGDMVGECLDSGRGNNIDADVAVCCVFVSILKYSINIKERTNTALEEGKLGDWAPCVDNGSAFLSTRLDASNCTQDTTVVTTVRWPMVEG